MRMTTLFLRIFLCASIAPVVTLGSRLTFTGNSETIKEIFEPLILSCSFQVAKHDVKENGNVILMYIFQETKGVIATISKGQPFAYSTEPRHTFAQGNIGDEKLNKSYLQVTRKNPNSLESGKYFCLAHVRDSAGKDKVFHASIKINIEKSNSDDLVPALGRVLERLDRIEERQEATEQKIVDAQEDFNIQIKNLSIVLDQEKPEKEEALGRVLERLDRIEERQEATEQKIVDAQEDFNIQIGNLSSVLDQEKPKKEEDNVLCNAGFHKITDGQISACVWVSNVSMNYIQARDDCKEKGAHLLTLKTQEKFTLLHKNDPGRYLWIGLTDRLIEDIFIWDDDNSICNPLCRGRLFSTGEPNDSGGEEDCVVYYPIRMKLNDNNCGSTNHYMCEHPI